MLKVNPITPYNTNFQAKPTSTKMAAQKLQKFINDASIPENLKKSLKETSGKYEFVTRDMSFMTKPKAQAIDDIAVFLAKQAPKEYATTSAKLAEQKATRLNVNL